MLTIVLSILLIAILIQLFYWAVWVMRFYLFLKKEQSTEHSGKSPLPVSVIICARNEAANLKKNLPEILAQDYPEFEVIVVDDDSEDDTEAVLTNLQADHPNLKVIKHLKDRSAPSGKKQALAEGISKAKNEILLLTDADCSPASKDWIHLMQENLRDRVKIGLGYGPHRKLPGFLNKLIRYETVYTAVQYFSASVWGYPYMGVGRNLAYRKELYEEVGGFATHEQIISGDDDLFINSVSQFDNIAIIVSEKSFAYSDPKVTWRQFYRQKLRHSTTGKYYKWRDKMILGAVMASHFAIYLSFIFLLVLDFRFDILIGLVSLRFLIMIIVYGVILRAFKEKDLLIWIPFLDFSLILLQISLAPALISSNTTKWK